jgi:isocitrate/isopropylmalate dehydrogenase
MAMFLAAASLLDHFPELEAQRAGKAISQAVFGAVHDGIRTVDLGGDVTTTQFTDAVIQRVRTRLGLPAAPAASV